MGSGLVPCFSTALTWWLEPPFPRLKASSHKLASLVDVGPGQDRVQQTKKRLKKTQPGSGKGHPPDLESARRIFNAKTQRALSRLYPFCVDPV